MSGAAVVAALVACGGGNDAANPQVASLPTTSSAGVTVAPPATAGRPQERLDDTPERHEALIAAWDACLVARGATYGGAGVAGGKSLKEPIPTAAKNACTDKLPIGPPELDPSQNLHYRDDMVAEINCLRAHGDRVHLTSDTSVYPNGLGWTYDDNATVPANEGQIEDACQLAAFGGK